MVESNLTLVDNLQRLDQVSLEKNGLEKLVLFLTEFLEGAAQGRQQIQLNMPFLRGESDTTNPRELLFVPTKSLPQDQIVRPISLLEIASLLDEVVEWLNIIYKDSPAIIQSNQSLPFRELLVRDIREVNENEVLDQRFQEIIEQKAAVILQTLYRLQTEVPKTNLQNSQEVENASLKNIGVSDTAKEVVLEMASQPTNISGGSRESYQAVVSPNLPVEPKELLPQDWEKLSSYERQIEAYQAISVHAGFLYNQIVSNTFNIYGLPPSSLPPEIEYELRQAILRELYQISPADLSRGGSANFNRLLLGRSLFEKLVLHNPKVFKQIEQFIESQAQANGTTLEVTDPLKVWDESNSAKKLETFRELSVRIIQTESEPETAARADTTYQNISLIIHQGVLSQGFLQNDNDFTSSMTALGFEQIQVVNIRRLITSYIQTTGIDPEQLLNSSNPSTLPEKLTTLFSVKVDPAIAPQFAEATNAYWRFQLEKLQNTAKAQIQPDRALLSATMQNQVSTDILRRIAVATNEFNAESYHESYDPRLYVLASLVTPTQLQDSSYLTSLRLALAELFGNDQVIIERAVQVIGYIQQAQKQQLAQSVAQTFNRREFAHFYNKTTESSETISAERESEITENSIRELDLQARRELVDHLFARQSSQASYELISNYLEDEMMALTAAGENSAYVFDPVAGGLIATVPNTGRPSFIRSLGGGVRQVNRRISSLRNAQKTISRVNTLGKSATSIQSTLKMAAGTSNPFGAAAGLIAGRLTTLALGKETGEKVEQLVAIGSIAAAIGSVISAIAAALGPFLVPVLAVMGAIGGGVVVSLVSGINSAGGAAGASISRVAQPVLGSAGPQVALKPVGGNIQAASVGSGVVPTPPTSGLPVIGTPSVAAVATGGTVVGGICLAAVATITIQGAFLDPARVAELTGESSPFVEITKEVSPNAIENNTPSTISYTITVTPKENYVITPIPANTTDTITYLGGDPLDLVSPIDSIRQQLGTTPINPGESREITYTFNDVSGVDVQVTNRFTLAFTVEGEDGEQTLSRSAFLRIGDPQIGCFNFMPGGSTFVNLTSKEWTADEMAEIQEAFSAVVSNAMYMSLLCERPIDLYRLDGTEYGGWAPRSLGGQAVGIYDLGLMYDVGSTRYTLIHELGHILDYRNSSLNPGFNSARTRSGCYSYPFPADCNLGEAFAEAVSLFVIVPGYPRLSEWDLVDVDPAAYNWINENIFGGEAIQR